MTWYRICSIQKLQILNIWNSWKKNDFRYKWIYVKYVQIKLKLICVNSQKYLLTWWEAEAVPKMKPAEKLLRLNEAATTGSVQANELARISRPRTNEHWIAMSGCGFKVLLHTLYRDPNCGNRSIWCDIFLP